MDSPEAEKRKRKSFIMSSHISDLIKSAKEVETVINAIPYHLAFFFQNQGLPVWIINKILDTKNPQDHELDRRVPFDIDRSDPLFVKVAREMKAPLDVQTSPWLFTRTREVYEGLKQYHTCRPCWFGVNCPQVVIDVLVQHEPTAKVPTVPSEESHSDRCARVTFGKQMYVFSRFEYNRVIESITNTFVDCAPRWLGLVAPVRAKFVMMESKQVSIASLIVKGKGKRKGKGRGNGRRF